MKVDLSVPGAHQCETDLLAVPVFSDEALPTAVIGCAGEPDIRSRPDHVTIVRREEGSARGSAPARVAAIGMGERAKLTPEAVRVAAAKIEGEARRMELARISWELPSGGTVEPEAAVRALVSGTVLANFAFDRFKSGSTRNGEGSGSAESPPDDEVADHTPVELLCIAAPDGADRDGLTAAADAERIAAEAQNLARELQATPANHLTPQIFAERAAEVAARHAAMSDETLGEEEIRALGMGGMTAVSQGSDQPPRLIVLRYSNASEDAPVLGLVGKSVTFDTGGISLKPSASMHEMKMDMSGGATVLAAVSAIAELDLPINLVAVLPTVENMPSGRAIKPGDVITQYDGTTVEVNNTDAEGRLVLADALSFCTELGASKVIDLATLTGAVLIALGSTCAATIANDDELAAQVQAAGEDAGDPVWRLPLNDEYRKLIKGEVADLSNAAAKREAGTIYAGAFLEHFVDETPWVHIDIAGTAWDSGKPYFGAGPTGYGVRLLVNLARRWAEAGK